MEHMCLPMVPIHPTLGNNIPSKSQRHLMVMLSNSFSCCPSPVMFQSCAGVIISRRPGAYRELSDHKSHFIFRRIFAKRASSQLSDVLLREERASLFFLLQKISYN